MRITLSFIDWFALFQDLEASAPVVQVVEVAPLILDPQSLAMVTVIVGHVIRDLVVVLAVVEGFQEIQEGHNLATMLGMSRLGA